MGEYGTFNGEEIKIGTCENMYYLRADQIHLVQSDTLRHLADIRFRFPFPDEDDVQPGAFDDYNRGLTVWGYAPPDDGPRHHSVQFKADVGILVNLPCPYSAEAKASDIKYHFNGYRGPARIVQQRVWAGVWATVLDCGACGARFRLPDLESARPLLDALEELAIRAERLEDSEPRAQTYRTIAERIERGYQTPVGEQ